MTTDRGGFPLALILAILGAVLLAVVIFFAGDPESGLHANRSLLTIGAGASAGISLVLTLMLQGSTPTSKLSLAISGITLLIVVAMVFLL